MVGKSAAPSPATASSDPIATTLTAEVPRSSPRVTRCATLNSDMSLQKRRNLIRGYQGAVDILVGVRERDEQIFERPGMKQYVALQHTLPPQPEQIVIGIARGVAIIANRPVRKPYLQDRAQTDHVG